MNTDQGMVIDYRDVLTSKKRDELRVLLKNIDGASVERFLEKVNYPVCSYYAFLRGHETIPDAKDQQRKLKTLTNKFGQLHRLCTDIDERLEDVPYELRRAATLAQTPIHKVQADMTTMMIVINDIIPNKSKYRPEIESAVHAIAEAFRAEFKTEPLARGFREDTGVTKDAPLSDMFVPIVAKLLNYSISHAFRLAEKIVPS